VEVYRKIAQTGYNLKVESTLKESEPKLFHRNISYLTPDVDVFESFGNFRDRADSRTAHEFLENGILLTNEEKFGEGIKNFELAKEFDPEFSLESSLRVELASDQWRKGENKRVSTYVKEGEFKDAVDVIRTMDGRLKRDNDWTVVASIRQLDHIATVRRADVLYKLGNAESLAKATDLYVGLLKEEDLTESLSVYVSTQLIGFVADCSNDRERHKKLDELILNNANPEVIDRFSDQLAKQLMREAQSNSAAGNYDLAIEKLFWAIVLPNQTKRREELFQTALYAFNRLLELNQKLSDSDSFKEPLFAELITELHDRWNAEQDKDDAAAFKRLDNEPWILKKQIDELLMLLERLSARTPSTDRLVDKLRLPRERQTQKLFLSIQEQLNLIFQEGDHARRREMIQGELRQLRKLAADFAGGNRPDYAKQISDFIAKAEDYLRNADQQQFLDEMDRESDERNETQFLELREMLRSDSDELILLETICSTARQLQETKFKSQVLTLASHWFERQAKPRYRSLMAKQPERVREVCGRSLDLLRSNENVLPDEAANFRLFLEKSLDDLQPRAEPDQESSTASAESAPPPPSPPRSAPHATVPPAAPSGTRSSQSQFRRFFAWLKSLFRGVS
jgi:hypothetical protein